MPVDIFAITRQAMEETGSRMVQDLAAIPEDKVALSPGGNARKVCDFVYEVAFINRRMAARLRGESLRLLESEGWVVAPEEYRSKELLLEELQGSVTELLAAYDTHGPAGFDHVISTPFGESTVFEAASFVTRHISYHDAQLNYVQAFFGDLEMHWG